MGKNVAVWTSQNGDLLLTAALLQEILGGSSGIISTPITTAGNGTLTAAALVGGQIGRTGPVAAYTDTTDTAANIVTALGGFVLGQTFQVRLKNATAFVQTLQGGTGVTFVPAASVVPPLAAGNYFGTVGGTAASPTIVLTHEQTGAIYTSSRVADEQSVALNTVGAGTVLAASVNAGVTARGGTQIAAFADTTDTAANIIAGVSALSAVVGSAVEWTYVNNTIFPATIGGGTGVTVSGATIVPANSWVKYLVTYTAAATVTMVAIEQGYFPKTGTVVANGATPVPVTDARVTAGSIIGLTLVTVGGTAHGAFVSSTTPQTGFSINSLAGDTSTYNYEIRG